jgi:hypothetical protein
LLHSCIDAQLAKAAWEPRRRAPRLQMRQRLSLQTMKRALLSTLLRLPEPSQQ